MSPFSLRKPRVRLALLSTGSFFLLSAPNVTSQAQLTEATLKGIVKDASGMLAPVPVTASNESTGQVLSTVTFVMSEL
jgi:hypothetical protein